MPTIFEDEPEPENPVYKLNKPPCMDMEHNPPMHIVIPAGKRMVHTCPSCGKVTTISGRHNFTL